MRREDVGWQRQHVTYRSAIAFATVIGLQSIELFKDNYRIAPHQSSPWYGTLKSSRISCSHPQVFIYGVNFQESRLVSRALTSFYGIGPNVCKNLMAKFYIHNTAKVGDLGDKQINSLAEELSTMTLENDLRRQLVDNIKRLRDMSSYRGRRHAMSLPVRGQNTRTQVSQVVVVMLRPHRRS